MAKASFRPFLDTSVVVSGLREVRSPCQEMLQQHARGELAIVMSRQVLNEVVATVRALCPGALRDLEEFFRRAAPEICADPDDGDVARLAACVGLPDAPILAAAEISRADCFVTTDPQHLSASISRCSRLLVLPPSIRLAALAGAR